MSKQNLYKQNKSHLCCKAKHPFEPYNIKEAKVFIIGSIPPHRFSKEKNLLCGDIDWYYGSKSNVFWDILKESCCDKEHSLCSEKAQKDFLQKHEIGIFDMIKECTRKEGCGSSDVDLYNISLIDACKIISNNRHDKLKLFFTSKFVADLFQKQTGVKLDLTKREMQNLDKVCRKTIEAMILYSPSPSWARGLKELREKNKNEKNQERIDQYRHICAVFNADKMQSVS